MTNKMVGSVLTLVVLLFSAEAAVAQTYTQMQWGMNKAVTPYTFGANINGVWRDFGTVSAAGVWNIPVSSISGLGTAAFQNTGTSGATVPLLNSQNTWSAQQTFSANPTYFTASSAGFEMGTLASSNTPYIDFHSSGNPTDYDARIVASGGNSVDGNGALSIIAKNGTLLTGNYNSDGGLKVGGSTSWLSSVMPGWRAPVVAVSPDGGWAASIAATRTSDNTGSRNFIIGSMCEVLVNNTSVNHNSWCNYQQTNITSTATPGWVWNEESSIENLGSPAANINAFSFVGGTNPAGYIVIKRLSAGVGNGNSPNVISAFMDMTNNNGQARKGIVFGVDALDTSSGYAAALSMGPNHGLEWFNSSTNRSWRIFSNNATPGSAGGQIILGAGTFDLYIGASLENPIAVSAGNVTINDKLTVNDYAVAQSIGLSAPATKTADYAVDSGATKDSTIIFNCTASCTLTLPSASTFTGRVLRVINRAAFTVVSASSNIVQISDGSTSTAILSATAGKWADLQSNGTNWVMTAAN